MLRRFVEASRRAEIVALVNSARSAEELGDVVCAEVAEAFEAEIAFLLGQPDADAPPEVIGACGLVGDQREAVLREQPAVGALRERQPAVHEGTDVLGLWLRCMATSPFGAQSGGRVLLVVGRQYPEPFAPAELALLNAVTQSTGHALERFWLERERTTSAARQAALARAAKAVTASLDPETVLEALCTEVAGALEADIVNVYFGDAVEGLVAVASYGTDENFTGFRRSAGEGLCGRAVRTGRPAVSNAYQEEELAPHSTAALREVRSGLSVPLHRRGDVDGALSAGFLRDRWVTDTDVEFLTAFAEIASIACRNAEEHADAQRAAMIDPLTGCLNHGAFQTLLREETARAERGGPELSLLLLDLQDFKTVNDVHGHPAGDTLLRSVGAALRAMMRPYDQVARYGGDEFAVLLPGTGQAEARLVAERIEAAIAEVRRPDGRPLGVNLGVAQWQPGEDGNDVLDHADALLRGAKHDRARDSARPRASLAGLRSDRRARRLATAGRIGARLARLLDAARIAETLVAELQTALEAGHCRLVRLHDDGFVSSVAMAGEPEGEDGHAWRAPQDEGVIGRALRERRAVLRSGRSDSVQPVELAVPVTSGDELWGAIFVRAREARGFTTEDAEFTEVVADHLGAALHTADLYRRLDQAYLGTAEALAAALEAKDDYTADHARSIADLAVAVGRELDLDEEHLRDLRYGAIFHDIGKIAIPDAILNKPAPLTPEEFEIIKTHPIAGEQILAPVPFLARVRRIVRHDHERWDGTGYPDGLRGPQIPIGARIVFVVDAYHAMTSNRPYRAAMPAAEARAELERHAGTQFDPTVVAAFLRVLDRQAG